MTKFNKIIIINFIIMFTFFNSSNANYEKLIYDFKITSITGEEIDFLNFKNKAIMLVNVASKCGFTNQYDDLQKLWQNYKDKGLVVIGIPSNQFGGQEPGTNLEIKDFCETNFNIDFLMTTKINVKGEEAHDIYKWALKNHGKKTIPKWNFHKILINKEGKIEETYSSFTNPMSKKITNKIDIILK